MFKIFTTKFIVCSFLALPILVFAQTSSSSENSLKTLTFDAYSVEYDTELKASNSHTAYSRDGQIVLSAFDENGDTSADTWLRFDNEGNLDLEAIDSDFDGKIDIVNEIKNDEISRTVKEQIFAVQEIILPPNPNPQTNLPEIKAEKTYQAQAFTVNPPPEKGKLLVLSILKWLVLLILSAGIGYLYWKKHYRHQAKK